MELPIPTHLQKYFTPIGDKNSENKVTGTIHCPCGCAEFEIWESNDRMIVKLICKRCGKETLLFDSGKHGWDGYVCGDDFCDRSLPFQKVACPKCERDGFHLTVTISSQGKQDFLDECVAGDDSFSPEEWVNGFEWITASLSCGGCGYNEKNWLDCETM